MAESEGEGPAVRPRTRRPEKRSAGPSVERSAGPADARSRAPDARVDVALDSAVDFAAVFDALPGVELLLAPDAPRYTMLAATAGRLAATMTTRAATIGRPLFEVFPDANPDNPAASGVGNLRASLDRVLAAGASDRMPVQRYDLQRPDGTWEARWWAPLNVPVRDAGGAVRYVVHRVEDVTEAVRLAAEGDRLRGLVADSERAREVAEAARDALADAHARLAERTRALAESEARFRAVQDASPLGFAIHRPVHDADGGVVDFTTPYCNEAAARLAGRPRAAVLAGRVLALWPGVRESGLFADYLRLLETGVPLGREILYEYDGLATGFAFTGVRLGDPASASAGDAAVELAVTFADATSRLRAAQEREQLLAAAERARAAAEAANRAKAEFLAVMSHELRTPLNAIGGYAELLELGIHGPVTEAQRTALARIQASQRHLLGLIAGVLDYSRVEAGAVSYRLAAVPVAEAVAEAEALVAPQLRARGLGYAWAGAPPDLCVRADREKLQQVLLNLLGNAVKFTEARDGVPGRVEVAVELADVTSGVEPGGGGEEGGGRVRRHVHQHVHLHVRDTGAGIAADQLARIFEPFVQADQRLTRPHAGVGLGLAISRDLARGMGGDLTVESTPGIGSTFTLNLPTATCRRL